MSEEIQQNNIKEMQKCILDILIAIDKVCKEHHLRYYLIAGTMLGAIRHGGFIPWDDDADIALPRKDYEELVKHAKDWLPNYYELVSENQDVNYPYQFVRIQDRRTTYILRRNFNFLGGVPVDVFPLDGMTENQLLLRWHYIKYNFVKKLLYFSTVNPAKHGKGIRYIFCTLLRKFVTPRWAHRQLDSIQKEFDYDTSVLVADHDNKPFRGGVLPKTYYGIPTPVQFEEVSLMGVENPDDYLRNVYGNYMKLPDSLPPCNFRYLDLHKPYSEYQSEL